MTKQRPALSFHLALTRIAGLIDWPAMALATGCAERTIRNWSDPDTGSDLPMEAGLKLDLAWRVAGGEGAPLLDCYRVRFDSDAAEAMACERALLIQTATTAKEAGEAVAALAVASVPGASHAVKARARLEAEEAITAFTNTLPHLAIVPAGPVSPGGE